MSITQLYFISDLHIGLQNFCRINPATGVSSTLEHIEKELNFHIGIAIERKSDAIIIPGDTFHTRTPTNYARHVFTSCMKPALSAGIPIYVLLGNHDILLSNGSKNSLSEIANLELPNLKIIEKSQICFIKDCKVIFLPWQKSTQAIVDDANRLKDKIIGIAPVIIVGHFSVTGAQVGSEKLFELYGDTVVPIEAVMDQKVQYTFLGHIHKPQILRKKVRYIGSLDRVDFGERLESKGGLYFTIDGHTKEMEFEFVEGHPRKFRQYDFETIKELKEYDFKPEKGEIVKITVKGTRHEKRNTNFDDVYKKLQGCEYVKNIEISVPEEEQRVQQTRVDKELNLGEALKIWLQNQKLEEKLKEKVQKEAKRLLQENLI